MWKFDKYKILPIKSSIYPEGLVAITDQCVGSWIRYLFLVGGPELNLAYLVQNWSNHPQVNLLQTLYRVRARSRNTLHGYIFVFSLNAVERLDPGTGLTLSSTTIQVGAAWVAKCQCSGSVGYWAPGSASGSVLYSHGSVHQQAKNEENPWFLLFCDLFMGFFPWRMM